MATTAQVTNFAFEQVVTRLRLLEVQVDALSKSLLQLLEVTGSLRPEQCSHCNKTNEVTEKAKARLVAFSKQSIERAGDGGS